VKKPIRLSTLALTLLLLAGCSGTSYIKKAKNIASWKQTISQLQALQQWQLSGKISIRSADDIYTADLFWQQKAGDLTLRLIAPFSQGATQFSGNEEKGYQVLTDQGELYAVDSPESATENAFGVSLPFSELRSWIKGLPVPDLPVWRARFNDDNRLQSFEQSGWQVKILNYTKVADQVLPAKLFLSRLNQELTDNKVEIRLILRRWVL